MNIHIQEVGIGVTMRSIVLENKEHRIGQRKELNCEAVITKDSVNYMRTSGAGMTFRDMLP